MRSTWIEYLVIFLDPHRRIRWHHPAPSHQSILHPRGLGRLGLTLIVVATAVLKRGMRHWFHYLRNSHPESLLDPLPQGLFPHALLNQPLLPMGTIREPAFYSQAGDLTALNHRLIGNPQTGELESASQISLQRLINFWYQEARETVAGPQRLIQEAMGESADEVGRTQETQDQLEQLEEGNLGRSRVALDSPFSHFENHQHLQRFLQRLQTTAEFQSELARPALATRVVNMLQMMLTNPRFRDQAMERIEHSLVSCDDRVIMMLNQIELQLRVIEAEESPDPEFALQSLAVGLIKLDKVHQCAAERCQSRTDVDEVEQRA